MNSLSSERALIFRITHYKNLPWIINHGLHCKNSPIRDPNFVEIGRPEIISRRSTRVVDAGPGGTLSDYVPFYFCPRTPMLLNIRSGWQGLTKRPMNDIVILVGCLRDLEAENIPFVFSDRNATLEAADFYVDLEQLDELPWNLWQNSDFKRDDARPDKIERYMAEALIHKGLQAASLKCIVCCSEARKTEIEKLVLKRNLQVPVYCRPGWYC